MLNEYYVPPMLTYTVLACFYCSNYLLQYYLLISNIYLTFTYDIRLFLNVTATNISLLYRLQLTLTITYLTIY